MGKIRILVVLLVMAFLFAGCTGRTSPTSPSVPLATVQDTFTPGLTGTVTATLAITGTLSVTCTITETASITETGSITQTATVTFTVTETHTITLTPTTTNSPTAAEYGSMTADRSLFLAGETGITVVMVYTAARDWNPSVGHGVLEIGLPPGFSPFSANPLDKGYFTVSCPNQAILGITFCCSGDNSRINVSVPDMNNGDTITVTYGDKSGGGPGADAASYELTSFFECLVGMDGDYTDPIQNSPLCFVRYPTNTPTETVTCSETATITESATCTVTRTITDTRTHTLTRTVTETRTPTFTCTVTPTYTFTPENKYFGGAGSEELYSVCTDAAGGIYAAGYTNSYGAGGNDVLLVKYSADGVYQWYKTYGTTGSEYGKNIKPVSTGGFIITGYVGAGPAGGFDFYLVRTDADGNELWTKTFGDASHNIAYRVIETADGGFLLAGEDDAGPVYGDKAMYAVKTDSSGNFLWEYVFDRSGDDYCRDVIQTADGNYILFGSANYYGLSRDMYLVKFDAATRALIWESFSAYSDTYNETAYSVLPAAGGDFIAAGFTSEGGADSFVTAFAPNGGPYDYKSFGSGVETEYLCALAEDTNGYVAAGYAGVWGRTDNDLYLIKLDKTVSNPWLWEKYIGGTDNDYGYGLVAVNGGFVAVGTTNSYGADVPNGYITKIDADGNRVW